MYLLYTNYNEVLRIYKRWVSMNFTNSNMVACLQINYGPLKTSILQLVKTAVSKDLKRDKCLTLKTHIL